MLTPDERGLVQRIFAQGPAALAEAGYDGAQATAFIQRPDVVREWAVLTREHDHQEIVWGHTKFVLKRQLTRLGPQAAAVLEQALGGPEYLRTEEGHIQCDAHGEPIVVRAEVTRNQLVAAQDVLERLEVSGRVRDDVTGKLNIKVLFEKDRGDAQIEIDPNLKSEEQRALSRERTRNMIEILRAALPALKQKADRLLEGGARPRKAKARVLEKKAPPAARPTKKKARPRKRRANAAAR